MLVFRRAHRRDLNTKLWISSPEWQLLVGDERVWFHTSVHSEWMCSTAPLAGEPWVPTVLTDSCENLAKVCDRDKREDEGSVPFQAGLSDCSHRVLV